jgi:hypothetical protein
MIFIPISSVLIKLGNLELIKYSFNFPERLYILVGKETEPREKHCIYTDTVEHNFSIHIGLQCVKRAR